VRRIFLSSLRSAACSRRNKTLTKKNIIEINECGEKMHFSRRSKTEIHLRRPEPSITEFLKQEEISFEAFLNTSNGAFYRD
jgi:hypothetical protein